MGVQLLKKKTKQTEQTDEIDLPKKVEKTSSKLSFLEGSAPKISNTTSFLSKGLIQEKNITSDSSSAVTSEASSICEDDAESIPTIKISRIESSFGEDEYEMTVCDDSDLGSESFGYNEEIANSFDNFENSSVLRIMNSKNRLEVLRKSAFAGGPLLMNWYDVETTAVIKLQALFRRYRTVKMLEKHSVTTKGMKNQRRIARGNCKQTTSTTSVFGSTWGYFFGSHSSSIEEKLQREERHQQKVRQLEEKEANLRKISIKPSIRRQQEESNLVENIEVVNF